SYSHKYDQYCRDKGQNQQKLATPPQTDLEVPETPEEDKIVDPANLPNQDQWPFMQEQIADAQKTDPTLDQTRQKVENQSRAGASRGGMHHKRAYIDPILPTHNRTMQTNQHFHNNVYKLSTLFDYISIANELPNFCTLTVISRQLSIVWCQPFTLRYGWLIVWSRKSLTSCESHNFVELKLFRSTPNRFLDMDTRLFNE
uniref:Uncharacterized protein n=1 Tax=Romanomermis culicivorax TaxID=13658 RepID=A0A915KH87_ROMCU